MSYNNNYGRGGGGGGGYGQQNPYGRDNYNNPYDQPQQPYGRQDSPARNPFEESQSAYSGKGYAAGTDVEMGPLMSNQDQGGYNDRPKTNILDETRRVNQGSDEIDAMLSRLESAHRRALNDTATDRNSPTVREVDTINSDIMAQYRNLLDRMKRIKSTPGANSDMYQRHIAAADRKLQATRQRFMQLESEYQRRMKEQTERQYRTAFPTATEEEVRVACEEPNQQVFAQAMMQRDRRGESRQVLGAVRDRHEAIQKIERQMIELAQLFTDMERMVVEQEPLVEQIEQSAMETHENLDKANVELTGANEKARAARRKKWICFWISLLLLIIIVAVVVIVVVINTKK